MVSIIYRVEHWARSRGFFNDPRVGWSPDEPMPIWLLHIPPTREHVTICRWDGPVPEHGRIVAKAPFAQAQAWIDVFDQLPDDAARERHLVALVDIARVVEHWARVSPKWYPTGGSLTPLQARGYCRPHELAQAIFMESDAAPVFVGKCPDCTRGVVERVYTEALEPWYDNDLLTRKNFKTVPDKDGQLLATWTCSACEGTGEKRAPVAVLLDTAADGDAAVRDVLLAHADQLLADGNPLGDLLSWALLWLREPTDLRHADEAVRWLEWLTAQHELMRKPVGDLVIEVDGYTYRIAAHDSMAVREIVAALNAQDGPVDFHVAAGDSLGYTFRNEGNDSALTLRLAPPIIEHPASDRRGHAPHIGSRLGRRLGVRR